MRVHRKAKISVPETTARQQSVIKAIRLTQNFFSAKSIYKCVSYFTIDGNEWQQQIYYGSEDHPALEDVKFIRKTKFPAKVLLWLVVSESGNWKKKVYSKNYRPKDVQVQCLIAKIRKELRSIETTGTRKAMKGDPAKARKAHKVSVPFFPSVLCNSLVLK
jgi:hypothetical protein